ncbi:hypothetical protein [Streptomyces sp. NPDC056144]|uniref:hypothetical protein n=1 Tax=unclassified Streptomyces TaxID=2593676 RepID=UPI0035D564F5
MPEPKLANTYTRREPENGAIVFDTRLGLTVLELLDDPVGREAHLVADESHRRTMAAADGYAARDCLATTRFTVLLSARSKTTARALVQACALDSRDLPAHWAGQLLPALRLSGGVIRVSVRPS